MNHGLGRLAAKDARDAGYPMRAALSVPTGRLYRYWNDTAWFGDQGATPACVGFAWAHWLTDGPVTHKGTPDPLFIYQAAQKRDEWPGEDYAGTSVRAGAKVLKEAGSLKEYRWAANIEDVVQAVLELGPVVVGTNWYSAMFTPVYGDRIAPTGSVAGGHAYLLNGINLKRGLFRLKNSWGRDWAGDGRAMISVEDMERLLFLEDGEACIGVETAT